MTESQNNSTPKTYPPFWKRVIADLIDAAIMSVFSNLLVYLLVGNTGSLLAQKALMWFFTAGIFVYWAIWESSVYQASPGKILMRLRVVSDSGKKVDALQALGRNAAKFISIAAVFAGIVAILFSPDRKGWHDAWSKTQVTV